jgi:integrase
LLDQFAESRRAIVDQRTSHTIGTLWAAWLEDRAEDGLSNAIHNANWTSMAPYFESRAPEHLTIKDCRAYARDRFALGRAPSTVHTELSRLRACLHWAYRRRMVPVDVDVWVPTPSKPRDRVLTRSELLALLDGAGRGDPHVYVFVVLLICTSARHSAILDLTWDRVDFDARTITYDENRIVEPMSKTWRKGRATVPMPRLAHDALLIAKRGRQTDYVVEHGGRRLRSVRNGFASAVERAGIPGKVTPHTIRHTIATLLRESGLTNDKVALHLGHNDPRTTDLVYTHTDVEFIRNAADMIDAIVTE